MMNPPTTRYQMRALDDCVGIVDTTHARATPPVGAWSGAPEQPPALWIVPARDADRLLDQLNARTCRYLLISPACPSGSLLTGARIRSSYVHARLVELPADLAVAQLDRLARTPEALYTPGCYATEEEADAAYWEKRGPARPDRCPATSPEQLTHHDAHRGSGMACLGATAGDRA